MNTSSNFYVNPDLGYKDYSGAVTAISSTEEYTKLSVCNCGQEPEPDKVLFLDVDNTLTKSKDGTDFPGEHNWVFKPGVLEALNKITDDFDKVILVTNQGGVNSGYKTPQEVLRYINEICNGLQAVLDIYPSVHIAFLDEDRKPYLGDFIHSLTTLKHEYHKSQYDGVNYDKKLETFSNIDLENSLMIGDASGKIKAFKGNDFRYYHKEGTERKEGITLKTDFSDSDKQFADRMGVNYLDIEQFLKNYES